MALLLFIDTSTKNCSALLAEDHEIIVKRLELDTRSHAQILPVFIEELFAESGRQASDLDAVVVSAGPGSYTGLRIGMSTAKGMCYALDIPLIALDSLENLALTMFEKQKEEDAIYIATLDSRKGEIYYAAMNGKKEFLSPSIPAKVDELDWDKWRNVKIYFAGNTYNKLLEVKFDFELSEIYCQFDSENYLNQGFEYFVNKNFDNLVYKEPNYLKPFQ